VGLQIVRDGVLRLDARGPDGLVDRKAPGRPSSRLHAAQRQALAAMVESSPMPAVHGVVRWRLADLAQSIWEEFRIAVSAPTVSRAAAVCGSNNHRTCATAAAVFLLSRRLMSGRRMSDIGQHSGGAPAGKPCHIKGLRLAHGLLTSVMSEQEHGDGRDEAANFTQRHDVARWRAGSGRRLQPG